MYNIRHSKENQVGELFMYMDQMASRNKFDAMYEVWYFKENQLRNLNLYKVSFEDRDHMAARDIYINYLHPHSIPPKGSASVSNHCNGETSISFSVEILDFLGNQDF
eukprot:NODE_89_length_21810_cov_0.170098.p16 type:complete len:107 gc:universal NODE_89_length_21810_cov_0.170098:11961-12281(+)